ncbi:ribonucrease Y [Nakamurella panacisegetis]|uniref:Ribonuclease Y n=1 Tax=Nakamurella panacisegetis TaxID=1090615 RepID=A0A1H0Q528_9ACTN|nr:ribonuclease Y [Nakamurella panacisegetis]SDP12135.1 ribonucrease Y [Nakamurella panacisegetis]
MPNALIVVLAVALVVALAALIVILKRQTSAPTLDENAIRRLLTETMDASGSRESAGQHAATPTAEPTPGGPPAPVVLSPEDREALNLLRQEASAAAAEIRRVAADAADSTRERSIADAARLRAEARAEAEKTIEAARSEAAALRAGLQAERHRLAQEAMDGLAVERQELQDAQQRLRATAALLNDEQKALTAEQERLRAERQELSQSRSAVESREGDLRQQAADLAARAADLDARSEELQQQLQAGAAELTRISGLTIPAARAELLASQEDAVRRDAAFMIRRVESEAEATAKVRARAIVSEAVQRVASDQTAQTVVSVVHLPADEVKGRIIGREGRNIRTFETITGVNVIIDDTPEAVLLSCFDPVRREVGRITLQMLIDDGRIHPHRIEEAFERAGDEVDALCRRAAEDAMLDVGISDLHPELVNLIGRLKYRTSYGQNVLGHLVETSHIARIMASEMGIDPKIVARGAFLHDIGKALTHEAQGSHAIVGAELARKYGESEAVAHCIEAHHDEVPPSTVEAVLTQAADSCSGGRPGARRESLESYVQRLERIEAIAGAKKGVEKVFAMQAGRELRVMVKPEVVDDLEAHVLAREVAKQIEEELTYPGQVRVTVIRESRATEIAR